MNSQKLINARYLYALAYIICFISIGGSFTNPNSVIDIKAIENNTQESKASLLQDVKATLRRPCKELDQVDKEYVKKHSNKDNALHGKFEPENKSKSVGPDSKNAMLSAYAPEFVPLEICNSKSFTPTNNVEANYPHDLSNGHMEGFDQGSKSNSGHNSVPLQIIQMEYPNVLVPISIPLFLGMEPLITAPHIGQPYHSAMDMQPINLSENVSRQNQKALFHSNPMIQRNHDRDSIPSSWRKFSSDNDGTNQPHTKDQSNGSSKQEPQSITLKRLPAGKGFKIPGRHRHVMVEKSRDEYKPVQDGVDPSEPVPIVSKAGILRHEGSSHVVTMKGTSNIENEDYYSLQKSLKPVKLGLAKHKEKDEKLYWSEQRPLTPIKPQTEANPDQEMAPKIAVDPITDPLETSLRFKGLPLKESPKEVNIARSSPRQNQQEHQTSSEVDLYMSESTEIQNTVPQDHDDWIIPKKLAKNNQTKKVNFSQDFKITETPKIHFDPSSESLNPLDIYKIPSPKLQKTSKKQKKKKNPNSKSNVNTGKRAVRVVDDDWETELSKALEETSLSDQRTGTDHERLMKDIRKRLQTIFVADGNYKIDGLSPSSIPSHSTLIKEFLNLDNQTPLLELKMKPQTFKFLREAEDTYPKLYNTNYCSTIIEKISGDKSTSVEDIEVVRRKIAFFAQYSLRRDTEIFKEKQHTWSKEARQLGIWLHYENPFEMFLESTEEELDFLERHVNLALQSHDYQDELMRHISSESLFIRSIMRRLRIQELKNQSPYSFFGKDFLERAFQQGIHVISLRQLEITLELSAPEVFWRGLSEAQVQTKYLEIFSVMGGMPSQHAVLNENDEVELYSRARKVWTGSRIQRMIKDDADLSRHVTNRLKLLLLVLKGKKPRPLRELCHVSEHSVCKDLNEEIISRDEALAATFVGITLHDLGWFKMWQRRSHLAVRNRGNRRQFVHWPESLVQKGSSAEVFTMYHELLGIKLLLKNPVSASSITEKV